MWGFGAPICRCEGRELWQFEIKVVDKKYQPYANGHPSKFDAAA
jgi:hypothetical protein